MELGIQRGKGDSRCSSEAEDSLDVSGFRWKVDEGRGKEGSVTVPGGFQVSLWGRSLECFLSVFLFQH